MERDAVSGVRVHIADIQIDPAVPIVVAKIDGHAKRIIEAACLTGDVDKYGFPVFGLIVAEKTVPAKLQRESEKRRNNGLILSRT